MTVRVALVGCGRWGSRLLEALRRHDAFDVQVVADCDGEIRRRARHPHVVATLDEALERELDAVVIATPPGSHAALARRVIEAGLDLLVEKPLARCAFDAAELAVLARERGSVAMVGHVLRYHPAYERLIERACQGELGTLLSVEARRVTRSGTPSPLWALGPHDVSTLLALDRSHVLSIDGDERAGLVHLEVAMESGASARLALSTSGHGPERRVRVVGTRGSVDIDEMTLAADPLERELSHFARSVRSREAPRTSFDEGARVVAFLERAERELAAPAPIAEQPAVARDSELRSESNDTRNPLAMPW